jgi:hypothetical protein
MQNTKGRFLARVQTGTGANAVIATRTKPVIVASRIGTKRSWPKRQPELRMSGGWRSRFVRSSGAGEGNTRGVDTGLALNRPSVIRAKEGLYFRKKGPLR